MTYAKYISLYIFNLHTSILVYIFDIKNAFYVISKKASLR